MRVYSIRILLFGVRLNTISYGAVLDLRKGGHDLSDLPLGGGGGHRAMNKYSTYPCIRRVPKWTINPQSRGTVLVHS
jgi:hypothetical protein